ncbi:MAG: efflux RND transporter periplasmic adaptor subunit [Oceanicaulis sp.]|uniref:efflux RND transporter periplasmic adaptor subunit n=1 Tax=Glycocaulis sp. TaxID=1969725 RepID=UPI0025B9B0FB|nr:efflux RND transporter periplasmic adaptor subunit [Glycocaulis sp.]MCC5980999.1 efflux RND transporter periplasmic adaptor subunit [Oceanicaulis sp.]MCH8522255.1 efflux RND transporter periplasmic adaptor subunit [Glycocaulis sp.]
MQAEDAQPEDVNDRLGWIQIAIVAGIIVGALALTAWLAADAARVPRESNGSETAAAPVEVTRPERIAHSIIVETTGTVRARALVALVPEVSGQAVEVAEVARAGGRFEAGETLAQIDPRNYRLAVDRARAALADAQSALMRLEAEAGLAREEWERLYPGEPIAPLTALEPQLEAARARLIGARADLEQARLNLDRTALRFPFAGRITDTRLEVGQQLNAGQSYGEAFALDALELAVPLSPDELTRIAPAEGRSVEFTLEGAPSQTFTGTIVREGARLDDRSRLITVFVRPDDPLSLRPGQFARVRITGNEAGEIMRLPASAMAGLSEVRTVRDGRIAPVRVDVLDRTARFVFVAPFEVNEGVIISPLPESVLSGPVVIIGGEDE